MSKRSHKRVGGLKDKLGPLHPSIYTRIGAFIDTENDIARMVDRRHFMALHGRAWAIQRAIRKTMSLRPPESVTSESGKVLIE